MPIDPSFVFGDIAGSPYYKNRSLLTELDLKELYRGILQNIHLSIGAGNFNTSTQSVLTRLDRYRSGLYQINTEQVGYTFITRPRLNLSDGNIRLDRILNTLDTTDVSSGGQYVRNVQFMTRCLLDTVFTSVHAEASSKSPVVDMFNPFLTPLCNCLTDISGWPDIMMETEQTEGGFHQESMSFAKGSDMNNKPIELSLGFKDIQGGLILNIFYIWVWYMALQCKGDVISYEDDIYQQRLNYTVSIYRFITDPSRKRILKWSKATGCFPKNVPIGACFNFSESDSYIEASRRFSIPFQAHWPRYNDSGIIRCFNRLMKRYVPGIDTSSAQVLPDNDLQYNYFGYPYIVDTPRGFEIEFRALKEDVTQFNSKVVDIDEIVSNLLQTQTSNYNDLIEIYGDELYTIEETPPGANESPNTTGELA